MTYPNSNITLTAFQPLPHNTTFIDLTGHKYGRLTVIGYMGKIPRTKWFCHCDCGKTVITAGVDMRTGNTASCGCLHNEQHRKRITKHGQAIAGSITPEFRAYLGAKDRCNNSNLPQYKNYGGRGIKFLFNSFNEFYAELGQRPTAKHSVDRINNNGNYEPGNVRWATRKEQNQNSRQAIWITIDGQTRLLMEWCKILGITYGTVHYRIKYKKMDVIKALTTPVPMPHQRVKPPPYQRLK